MPGTPVGPENKKDKNGDEALKESVFIDVFEDGEKNIGGELHYDRVKFANELHDLAEESREITKKSSQKKSRKKEQKKGTESAENIFAEKFGNVLKKNLFNNKGECLFVFGFDNEKSIATVFDISGKNRKRREVSYVELEELLKEFNSETLPRSNSEIVMDDAETGSGRKEPGEGADEESDEPGPDRFGSIEINPEEEPKSGSELAPEPTLEPAEKEESGGAIGEPSFELQFDGEEDERRYQELQEAVKNSRANFARKNYEVNSAFRRFRELFGRHMRSTENDIDDHRNLRNDYQAKLRELLQYEVQKLREGNFSSEELDSEIEKLTKYFNQDEKVNLYEARTDARAEVLEKKWGKVPGWIAKHAGNLVNGYRKMNWKAKLGLGIAAGLSGAGLLVAGQRVIGSAALGTGVAAGLEARYRKKENEKLEEERRDFAAGIEGESDVEQKFEKLMRFAEEKIGNYDQDLEKELGSARNRRLIGAGVGVAAFALPFAVKHLEHMFGHQMPEPQMMSGHAPFSEASVQEAAQKIAGHSANIGGVETAVKGDSVWKMIGRHFIDNKEFSALNPEQKTYVIDTLKDRISDHHSDFGLKNIDKIKIGYELDFTKLVKSPADFHSIVEHAKNLTQEQMQNIHHNNESILHWVNAHHGQALTSDKVEQILHNAQEHVGSPVHGTPENLPVSGAETGWAPVDVPDHSLTAEEWGQIGKLAGGGSASFAAGAVVGGSAVAIDHKREKMKDFAKEKAAKRAGEKETLRKTKAEQKLSKKYDFVPGEEPLQRAQKIARKISLNNIGNWRLMKEVEIGGNYEKILTKKLSKNISELRKLMEDCLGKEEARVDENNKNETLKVWLARMIKKLEAKERGVSGNLQNAA